MKKSKWRPPYTKDGKTNFPLRKKSGVYLIKKKDLGSIVYVGFSGSDLYKTMYRHFQQWTHPQQPVVTYVNQDRNNFFSPGYLLYTKTGSYFRRTFNNQV